jgi:hypothetical protein
MLNPISFSIPREKIINYIPLKTKILSDLIPGKLETYIYKSEKEYYDEYKQSFFALTTKKAGWDCMRHYEIIANGCVPYFPNIENCPKYTMVHFPKDLIIQGNILYKKFENRNIDYLRNDELNEYNSLVLKLLIYLKKYLTTDRMAKYILEKSEFKCELKKDFKILFLSENLYPDYLRCLTLHGFKRLLGSKCHDFPKISHLYENNNINPDDLYGKGFTYSNLLDPSLHDDSLDKTLEYDIANKNYDIIIYGSYHRGMLFYKFICKYYNPEEIILLCGEDCHECGYNLWLNKKHKIFVRELDVNFCA